MVISGGGKCSDSRYILKVELIWSADGYSGGYEEKKVVKGDAKICDELELLCTELRETVRGRLIQRRSGIWFGMCRGRC